MPDEKSLLSQLIEVPEEDDATARERALLSQFAPVEAERTLGGYGQEALKAAAKGFVSELGGSTLQGFSAFQTAIERNNLEEGRALVKAQTERMKNPAERDDALKTLRQYAQQAAYLPFSERYRLNNLLDKAGEDTDPDALFEAFAATKETPVSERIAYKAGEAIKKGAEKLLPRDPAYQDSVVLDFAEGLGTTGAGVTSAVVGGVPGVVATSALSGISEQLERAKAQGLKDEEAIDYALAGAGPGVLGTLSAELILRKLPMPVKTKMAKIAKDLGITATGEAMIEATQQALQNAIESQYNEEKDILEGTLYAGAQGAGISAILRGVVLSLTRGRGAGISSGPGPGEPAVEADEIRRNLAREEMRIRAKTAPQDGVVGVDDGRGAPSDKGQTTAMARTVSGAAEAGEISQAGEPVTLTRHDTGDVIHAIRTTSEPNEQGFYEFTDRDGTPLVLAQGEFKAQQGWVTDRTNAELEADLAEWLKAPAPWRKVTVTDDEGNTYRGVEGTVEEGGTKRFIRDGDGVLHRYERDAVVVDDGWDEENPSTPVRFEGLRAEAKSTVQPLTEADKASPIPNDLIAKGKEVIADAGGAAAANKALAALGLPPVDEMIGYRRTDGSVAIATITDAKGETVSLLTEDGEVLNRPASMVLQRLMPLEAPLAPQGTPPPQGTRPKGETGVQEEQKPPQEVREQAKGLQEGRRGDGGRGLVPTPEPTQEGQGGPQQGVQAQPEDVAPQPPAQAADVAPDAAKAWWDSAPESARRQAVVEAGYSEQIAPGKAVASQQGRRYAAMAWEEIPDSLQELFRRAVPTAKVRKAQTTRTEAPAVAATPVATPTPPPPAAPPPTTVTTSKGRSVPVSYRVVEADSLITSQDAAGRINPAYPATLQPRNRQRAASLDQINRIAAGLRPEELGASPNPTYGAPIIGPDNVVESGNARTIALQKAYDEGKAEEYRAFLASQGYPVQGMNRPVLVRVREGEMTPGDRAAFAREANVSETLELSPTEQALSDAALLPDDVLALYQPGPVDAAKNRPFVKGFMQNVLSQAEAGAFITSEGGISTGGVKRIRNALLAKAFGESDIIETITESPDSDIKAIAKALEEVAPQWALMRNAAARGQIDPPMDQTPRLLEAVSIVRRARMGERNVAEFTSQLDMFTGQAIDPRTEAFLRLMFRDDQFSKPVGPGKFRGALDFYVKESMQTKPGIDLLGEATKTQPQIIEEAKAAQYAKEPEQAGLFESKPVEPSPKAEPSTQPVGGAEPRTEPTGEPGKRPRPALKKRSERKAVEAGSAPAKVATPKPRTQRKPTKAASTSPTRPTAAPDGLIYRKNGQPFDSAKAAMMMRKQDEYEAIEVEGGWAVRRKPIGKAEIQSPAPPPRQDQRRLEVNAAIRSYLDGIGLTDVVGFSQPVLPVPKGFPAGARAAGVAYTPAEAETLTGVRKAMIGVALDTSPDYAKTVRHEVIHTLRSMGLFYEGEWDALARTAKADKALMKNIRERYPNLDEEAQTEEAVADMFAAHASGKQAQKGFIGKILDKIKAFFKGLGDTFRSADLKTARAVMNAIEAGELGPRPRQETKADVLASENAAKRATQGLGKASIEPGFPKDVNWFKKYLETPRMLASLSRTFARVYVTQIHQKTMREGIAASLGRTYQAYQDLDDPSRAKVDKVLDLGMLTSKVFTPNAAGTITVTAPRETALMKAGESVTLTEAETEAYQSVRRVMAKALDLYRASTVSRFGYDPNMVKTPADAMALITPTTTAAEQKKIKLLAKLLADLKQSERTGYVPLSRFGNMVVVARAQNPRTGKVEVVHSESLDISGIVGFAKKTLAKRDPYKVPEIAALKAKLEAKYPGATVTAFQVAAKGDPRASHNRDVLGDLLETPPSELRAKLAELERKGLERGFRRHFFRAQKVPGYSTDFERAIADYVVNLSGNVARAAYHREWQRAIDSIPDNKPYEKEYARKYQEYIDQPGEEFAGLRQAGFVMFLASNLSNAALNLAQTPMIAAPYLGMFGGNLKAGGALARAMKDTGAMFSPSKAGLELFTPDKAPLDVRADLRRAWDEGEFVPLAMFDIIGVASGNNKLLRKLGSKSRRAVEYLAIPQTLTERANRVATYIAAHRMARTGGAAFEAKVRDVLKDNALAQDTLLKNYSPDAFGRWVVDEAHYDIGKGNRPVIMRGAGAALLQFQAYTVNTLETMYKAAAMSGKPGKVAFGIMLMSLWAATGMFSSPFSDDAVWLGELFYNWYYGLDKDVKLEVRAAIEEMTGSPKIAEIAVHGLTRYAGLDMTRRIGMGKILPHSPEEAGGVPLSLLAGRVWGAVTHLKDGRPLDAAMEALPLFAKNAAESARWGQAGVRTTYGDVLIPPEQVTPAQMAAKAVGWTPSTVAELREKEWSQQRASAAPKALRDKFYKRAARLLADAAKASARGDTDKALDARRKYAGLMEELQEHNAWAAREKKLHLIIRLQPRTLKDKVRAEYVGRGTIRDEKAPKLSRPRRAEIEEAFGQ